MEERAAALLEAALQEARDERKRAADDAAAFRRAAAATAARHDAERQSWIEESVGRRVAALELQRVDEAHACMRAEVDELRAEVDRERNARDAAVRALLDEGAAAAAAAATEKQALLELARGGRKEGEAVARAAATEREAAVAAAITELVRKLASTGPAVGVGVEAAGGTERGGELLPSLSCALAYILIAHK